MIAAAPVSALSQPDLWPEPCAAIAAIDALDERAAAARACAEAAQASAGPIDPRLIELYHHLGGVVAAAQGPKAALAALPFQRRAYRAAERALGADAPRTGRAALDHARGWILTGRCEGHDPRVLSLLEAAQRGFVGAPQAERSGAMRAIAAAYADVLAYEAAEAALLAHGEAERFAALDWERLARWRHRRGALPEARAAYEAALAAAPPARDALRMRRSLRLVLFELGDLEALQALD
ncbi:MAG: hypothetical protein AAGM38_05930 [Pseudomonadota bacterium]